MQLHIHHTRFHRVTSFSFTDLDADPLFFILRIHHGAFLATISKAYLNLGGTLQRRWNPFRIYF